MQIDFVYDEKGLPMVTLSKIYTRTGDDGQTGIGDGSRVSKLDLRIIAGGSVDETNSHLGLALTWCDAGENQQLLQAVQQRLFDLGADISCPWEPSAKEDHCPRIAQPHIVWLEQHIDRVNAGLSTLKSFILPGGTQLASTLHIARSVCRRAETDVLRLQRETAINPLIVVFMNRLSDLLFVLARASNNGGADDVLWEPDQGEVSAKE